MAENAAESLARVQAAEQEFARINEEIEALRQQKSDMQEDYTAALAEYERLVRDERLAEVGGSNGEQVVAVNAATEEGEASNG